MKNTKRFTKRALSVILTVLMVLSSVAAGLSVVAAASDWKHIEGTVYEPVTIYKNVSESGMVSGRTYRLGVYYYDTVLTVSSNGAVSLSVADTPLRNQPELYTSDDGSDVLFQTTDYYTEEDLGSDFVWQNSRLYNADTGRYIVNSGTTLTTSTSTTNASWTYNNRLSNGASPSLVTISVITVPQTATTWSAIMFPPPTVMSLLLN